MFTSELNTLFPLFLFLNRQHSLSGCVTQLARLGGYLARKGDAPPGNPVIWRGLARLTDIEIGFILGNQKCG